MKNVIYIVTLLLILTGECAAQRRNSSQRWSIGAGMRVGFGSMMQKSDVESDRTKGFDGGVDGVFTFYFAQNRANWPSIGFRTGLAVGYKQNSISMPIDLTYQTIDSENNPMTYHVTADDVKETDRQISLELPVMCALWYNNITANLGLRFGVPVLSRYEQKMTNPQLTATYDELGVTISGEKVTGIIATDDNHTKSKLNAAGFNMCLSLEAGYDLPWLILGNKLNVGIYTDYGLIDNFKEGDKLFTDADPSKIDGATNTPTLVVVRTLTDSYVSNVGVFDIGIRATYTFISRSKTPGSHGSGRSGNHKSFRNTFH